MRILINCASTFKGGSVQVARSIIYEATRSNHNEYIIAYNANLAEFISKLAAKSNCVFCRVSERPSQRLRKFKDPGAELRGIEEKHKPSVVFTTSGPSYWRPSTPHLVGFNLGHFIYPDSPFFQRISPFDKAKWFARGQLARYFFKRDADHYVVQTDDANKRLQKWLNKGNVYTVPNSLSDIFTETARDTIWRSPSDHTNFRVFVLSAYYPHKNLEIVDKIAAAAKKLGVLDIRFILTLPTSEYEKVISPSNRDLVENVGPLRPEQCPRHYLSSNAVLLPTLLECFSVTFLEAMAMDRPIVATKLGFSESICGDAALYYDPTNPEDAFDKLMVLKKDAHRRMELVKKGQHRLSHFGGPTDRFNRFMDILRTITI